MRAGARDSQVRRCHQIWQGIGHLDLGYGSRRNRGNKIRNGAEPGNDDFFSAKGIERYPCLMPSFSMGQCQGPSNSWTSLMYSEYGSSVQVSVFCAPRDMEINETLDATFSLGAS